MYRKYIYGFIFISFLLVVIYLYYNKTYKIMKKVINENTIKAIVKESLKNYLQESMPMTETDGWTPEMDDMWDEFGNNNVHDTDGAFGVLAQGNDDDHVSRVARSLRSTKSDTDANMGVFGDEPSEFASDDNAEYLRDKMMESIISKAVNEAFKKAMDGDDDDDYNLGWDKSKMCGDLKFSEKYHNNNKKTKDTKKVAKKSTNGKENWCGDKKFHAYNEKKNK